MGIQDWFAVFVSVIVFGLFGATSLFLWRCMFEPGPFLLNRASRNRAWERMANHLGGQFQTGGLFDLPNITFQHRGEWVTLDILAIKWKFTRCYPRLALSWPDDQLVLEINGRGFRIGHPGITQRGDRSLKTRLLGYPEIPVGSAEFQSAFVVTGNDPAKIQRLLRPEVKAKLNQFRTLTFQATWQSPVGCSVNVTGGEFVLMKYGLLNIEHDLELFVRSGLSLYDAMRSSHEPTAE